MADWWRLDDGELLAAARREGEAFGVFYDRHVSSVLAFFRRRTNGAELAMALTAETFARALEACRAGHAIGQPSPASWLFTIVRHLLIDAYRRGQIDDRARRRLALDPIVLTDEGLDRVEATAAGGAEQLGRLVAELPPIQREAIEAHVIQGRSYAEIAATLRCSESVVRQRVSPGPGHAALASDKGGMVMDDPIARLRDQLVSAAVPRRRARRLQVALVAAAVALLTAAAAVAISGLGRVEVERGTVRDGEMTYRVALEPAARRGEYCLVFSFRNGNGPPAQRLAPKLPGGAPLSGGRNCGRLDNPRPVHDYGQIGVDDTQVVFGSTSERVATVEIHGPGRGEIHVVRPRAVAGWPVKGFAVPLPEERPAAHPPPTTAPSRRDGRPVAILCRVLGDAPPALAQIRRLLGDPNATCGEPPPPVRIHQPPRGIDVLVARDAAGNVLEVLEGDRRVPPP